MTSLNGQENDNTPCNFIGIDIEASLWHEANATLRTVGLVQRQVVNIRSFICYFVVANQTVTLHKKGWRQLNNARSQVKYNIAVNIT